MLYSIRRRLPFSYAAIALVTALALGAVLLLVLRGYYSRVERNYLLANARAIGFSLASLIEGDQPGEVLQARLDSYSFLSGTRVRLLDTEGREIAASSPPGDYRVAFVAPQEGERMALQPEGRSVIVIRPGEAASATVTTTREIPLLPMQEAGQRLAALNEWRERAVFPLPAASSSSGQVVRAPVRGSEANLLGYVELSQGPSYMPVIVGDVARGWAIAGAVSVALAAAVGWLISRRITAPLRALTGATAAMAAGDLSARADATRRDELGTLARTFNAMADKVEDTVETLRRFISDAAHELHTPLATLRTTLEMMQDEGPPGQDERTARAQAQVERLEALTRGMLDLSRIEARAGRGEPGPVSLTALASEVGELYASQAEQREIEFELSLPETPVTIQGEEAQLRQALANLLDNAVKFTPEGGRVRLGLALVGDTAELWVEDTGIGIPEEDLPHLFQRFHRARNAEGFPGSGLGLAIVKAVVARHGGSVAADSGAGGTRVSIRLPSRGSR